MPRPPGTRHTGNMTVSSSASGTRHGSGTVPLAVNLAGVHKNFGHVHAVNGVDLGISSGEIVAILGPNGAGKTSTIDVILGLSQQTSGQALVFGMTPRQPVTRRLG